MRIRSRLTAAAAVIALAAAAGCSSQPFPPSPVPAPLNDLQAASMGDRYLHDQNVGHAMLHSALRQSDGYLLAYTTVFDMDGKPPKESRLLIVRNDGSVREIRFGSSH